MKRDIPNYQDRPHRPNNPASWYKVYRKLKKESDAATASGAERLKAVFTSIKEEKEQSLAKQISRPSLPTPKRASAGWSSRSHWAPSTANMSASEKIKRGQLEAQRARMLRERNQIKLGRQVKSAATSNNFTKVAVAPRSMIEELKKKNMSPPPEPQIVRPPVRRGAAPRPPLHGPKDEERRRPKEAGTGYNLISDREARLKAMQTKKHEPQPSRAGTTNSKAADESGGLSLDFLEDDDLFSSDEDGGAPSATKSTKPTQAPRKEGPRDLKPSIVSAQLRRSTSPRPLPAKRKAPPSLFMASSSPAKRSRPGVA